MLLYISEMWNKLSILGGMGILPLINYNFFCWGDPFSFYNSKNHNYSYSREERREPHMGSTMDECSRGLSSLWLDYRKTMDLWCCCWLWMRYRCVLDFPLRNNSRKKKKEKKTNPNLEKLEKICKKNLNSKDQWKRCNSRIFIEWMWCVWDATLIPNLYLFL